MKILGINGSGRTGGNTAVLVKAVLSGAAEAGATTRMIELGPLTIAGCDACQACKTTHRCVINDDMAGIYQHLSATDVLMLSSPVYLDHITAQLMAVIQRLYCYIGPALENYYPRPGAKAVLGITYGAGDSTAYDYVLDWTAARLKGYFDIETLGTFKIPSTSHSPILGDDHPEIRRAYEFGKTLPAIAS